LKFATVCCPLFAGIVAGGVVGFEVRREHRLKAEYTRLSSDAQKLETTIKGMADHVQTQRYPTAPSTPQEQPDFLNTLRRYAYTRQVRIARLTETSASTTETGTSASDQTAKPARPVGVRALSSQVDIQGIYNRNRQFLYDLLRSPRLFTLNDIKLTRSEHGL